MISMPTNTLTRTIALVGSLLTATLLLQAETPAKQSAPALPVCEKPIFMAAQASHTLVLETGTPTPQICLERFQRRVRECQIRFPCGWFGAPQCYELLSACVDEAEVKYNNCIARANGGDVL